MINQRIRASAKVSAVIRSNKPITMKTSTYRRVAAFDVKIGERTDIFAAAWINAQGQYVYFPLDNDPNKDDILQPVKFYECDHLGFRLPNQATPTKLTPY